MGKNVNRGRTPARSARMPDQETLVREMTEILPSVVKLRCIDHIDLILATGRRLMANLDYHNPELRALAERVMVAGGLVTEDGWCFHAPKGGQDRGTLTVDSVNSTGYLPVRRCR